MSKIFTLVLLTTICQFVLYATCQPVQEYSGWGTGVQSRPYGYGLPYAYGNYNGYGVGGTSILDIFPFIYSDRRYVNGRPLVPEVTTTYIGTTQPTYENYGLHGGHGFGKYGNY